MSKDGPLLRPIFQDGNGGLSVGIQQCPTLELSRFRGPRQKGLKGEDP